MKLVAQFCKILMFNSICLLMTVPCHCSIDDHCRSPLPLSTDFILSYLSSLILEIYQIVHTFCGMNAVDVKGRFLVKLWTSFWNICERRGIEG